MATSYLLDNPNQQWVYSDNEVPKIARVSSLYSQKCGRSNAPQAEVS
jgi:hypothetical protein